MEPVRSSGAQEKNPTPIAQSMRLQFRRAEPYFLLSHNRMCHRLTLIALLSALSLNGSGLRAEAPQRKPLTPAEESTLKRALTDFFIAPTNKQDTWKFSDDLEKLLRGNELGVRLAAWQAFRDAPIHNALKED